MDARAARSVLIGVALAISACGTPTDAPAGAGGADRSVEVLAKAEGWRAGLADAAGQPHMLLEVAADAELAQQAWDDNVPDSLVEADGEPDQPGIYADLDVVDLDEQVVVVLSSGESSTCPVWVDDLSAIDERIEVMLASAADADQGCTDDYQPYRLVLAVDRDRLPVDALPIERIDTPSENLTDVEGRAVVYPVG